MESLVSDRRRFLRAAGAAAVTAMNVCGAGSTLKPTAQIAITLDLEMSAQYPTREMLEWNFQKGNLDEATKRYSVGAARVAAQYGAKIHFFCVARVLEQPKVSWLKRIIEAGHPVGNHTYDHVNLKAATAQQTQFRFQRSPWLVAGKSPNDVVRENIRLATHAMKQRLGIMPAGFRTPGGFSNGLDDREDLQQMLLDEGFKWVSSRYPPHKSGIARQPPGEDVYRSILNAQQAAQPYRYPTGLVEIPMSPMSDVTGFRSKYWKREYFLKAVGQILDQCFERREVFDFIAHPSCLVVEDPDFEIIRLICERVRDSDGRAEFGTLDQIAARVPER